MGWMECEKELGLYAWLVFRFWRSIIILQTQKLWLKFTHVDDAAEDLLPVSFTKTVLLRILADANYLYNAVYNYYIHREQKLSIKAGNCR